MADAQSNGSSAEIEGYVAQSLPQPTQPPPQSAEHLAEQSPAQQPDQPVQSPEQRQTPQVVQFAPLLPLPPVPITVPQSVSAPISSDGSPLRVKEKYSKWNTTDDIILLDALIAQRNSGHDTGNAVFTVDAWDAVAEALKGTELISGGAEKSVPNCKARWQRLKIEYRIVKHLRESPGFSWDENTQMVTADVATWDEYIREHRDASAWRKKAFPCYGRVAYLLEDANGVDKGEAKFKRRWAAQATSELERQGIQSARPYKLPLSRQRTNTMLPAAAAAKRSASAVAAGNTVSSPARASKTSPTTSVFSIFNGTPMSVPVNGAYSFPQYVSPPHPGEPGSGKRADSPGKDEDQSASSKRPRTDDYTNGTPQPPPPHYPYPGYPPNAYGQPGQPIYYAMPPPHGSAPIPPGAVPMPAPGSASQSASAPNPASASTSAPSVTNKLAQAIQGLEENEDLSDKEFVKAVKLFKKREEVIDAYMAISSKRARSMYLKAELEDLDKS